MEPGEKLQAETYVYRACYIHKRDADNNFTIMVRHFTPHPKNDKDGLSVNWDGKASPESTLAILGSQYKSGKTIFKEHKDYGICKLLVSHINDLPEVKESIFAPVKNTPCPKGEPDNDSHSLITFTKHPLGDTCETVLGMYEHAKANGHVPFSLEEVEKQQREIRNQWGL